MALGCRASAIIYRKTRVYGDYQWIIAINSSARPLTLQPNATPSLNARSQTNRANNHVFFQFLFPFLEFWQVCLLYCQHTKIPNSNYKIIKKRKKCPFPFWHPWWTNNTNYEERAGLCKISVVVLVVAKRMAYAKFVRVKYLTLWKTGRCSPDVLSLPSNAFALLSQQILEVKHFSELQVIFPWNILKHPKLWI